MNRTTSEVLDLAADQIQQHGWGQGVSSWTGAHNAGLCLEGAIAAAAGISLGGMFQGGSSLLDCGAYKAVSEYLADELVIGPDPLAERQPLWFWNDRKARSAEDVIAVLRAAAAVERVKEHADQLTFQFDAA